MIDRCRNKKTRHRHRLPGRRQDDKMRPTVTTMMICAALLSILQVQTAFSAEQSEGSQASGEAKSVESERGRLAMQRIQTETEIRAREEQQRLEEEQRQLQRAQEEAARRQQVAVAESRPQSADPVKTRDMSRTLEQLRSLGELKDDGYITEEEFQKIKQKILDSQL